MSRLLLLLLLVALPPTAMAQDQLTLKIGRPANADIPTDAFISSLVVSKSLQQENIATKLIEMKTLSEPSQYVDLLRERVYDFAFLSTREISQASKKDLPHAKLLEVPLLFSNFNDQISIQNSIYGQVVMAEVGDTGIIPLAFWNRLPTHLISRTQIAAPEQLKGLRVRTYDQLGSDVFKQLGASPALLSVGETYAAVQSGTIEAAEIYSGAQVTTKSLSAFAHTAITNFRIPTGFFAVDQNNWASFSERHRQAIRAAIDTAERAARRSLAEASRDHDLALSEAGIKVVSLPAFRTNNSQKITDALRHAWKNNPMAGSDSALDLFEKIKYGTIEKKPEKRGSIELPAELSGSLYFATDRAVHSGTTFEQSFGTRSNTTTEITCGKVNFTWNASRRSGTLYEDNFSPAGNGVSGYQACISMLASDVSQNGGRLTIFVHGYSNSFSDGLRRAAAVSTDLGIAPLILWSWPSIGDTGGYNYDAESIEWSKPHFKTLIELLGQDSNIQSIDLISHSMGARLGIVALEYFTAFPQKLRNLIFVAPDVAQSIFSQRMTTYKKVGLFKTLYAAELDHALQISTAINREVRAGLGGTHILVIEEAESVDVSPVESSFWDRFQLNHAHAFEVPEALIDLKQLLHTGKSARDRGLDEQLHSGLPYWLLRPGP